MFTAIGDSGDTAATADRIMDFAGRDRIVLSGIDAVTGTPGNQAFTFIGNDDFDAPGQVRLGASGNNSIVALNTTGTGGAEMVIRLAGDITLTEQDFILWAALLRAVRTTVKCLK